MRTINNSKDKKVDFSKRKILSLMILTSFVGTGLLKNTRPIQDESEGEHFVLVNGWVLKKKDLDVT